MLGLLTIVMRVLGRRELSSLAPSDLILLRDGELIEKNLRRERMTAEDIAEEMRTNEIASFDEVQWAILENNGQISFVKK